jgi:membrane protease YdiL (CAAX protease family)
MKALKFFLLVFALSIPLWIIETIIDVKGLPLDIPVTDIVAAFTPLIAASVLVYKEEGRIGTTKLLKRIFDFLRITKKIWYVPVIFLPFLMYLVIYIIIRLTGLDLPSKFHITFYSIPVLFLFFFLGAVAEETGYMGYAIDPMQKKFGALSASIVMGIPWAIWHYPSIIQQGHNAAWIAWGTLGTVAARVLIVWIYNNTGRSLFACILFHTMLNLGRPLFPKDEKHNPLVDYPYIHYSVFALVAFVIVVLWGSNTLARFRFGYTIKRKTK